MKTPFDQAKEEQKKETTTMLFIFFLIATSLISALSGASIAYGVYGTIQAFMLGFGIGLVAPFAVFAVAVILYLIYRQAF